VKYRLNFCLFLCVYVSTDLLNSMDAVDRRNSLTVDACSRGADESDQGGSMTSGIGSERRRSLSASPPRSPSNNSSSGDEPEQPSDSYKYQRRRSRAVLYQLSGTYGKHKSTKSKLQLNKVGCVVEPQCFDRY
jgi:hypothetical protein